MNLQQFIDKYLGKTVGYPHESYVGECLSLVKWYIKECFNINPPASGCNAARCYWSKFPNPLGTVFKKVANTPELVPEKGWIAVWNEKAGGGYGHIGIVLEANINTFVSLDQNYRGKHAHKVTHNYNNVYGFLVPKVSIKPEIMPTKTLLEHIKVKDDAEGIRVWEQEKAFLEGARKKNTELTEQLSSSQENLKTEIGISNDRKKELEEIAYLLGTEVTVETARRNVEEIISRESGYIQQVAKLEKAVEEKDNKIIAQKLKHEEDLDRLQEKIMQMEKKHSLELSRLREQVGNVQQQVGDTNKQEAEISVLKRFLDSIKKFIMKY